MFSSKSPGSWLLLSALAFCLTVTACSPASAERGKGQFLPAFQKDLPMFPVDAVTAEVIGQRLTLVRNWYLNNLKDSGEMPYLYKLPPGRGGREANNMIRQFMTTLAMFRLADFLNDGALREGAEKNLAFNLDRYMQLDEKEKIAFILFQKKAKLGAAAFALMSLLESRTHPERDKLIEYFYNFIDRMQRPDGSFVTFYRPYSRNDNQNFYPGEAMLALMSLYESDPGRYGEVLDKVERAFAYYRNFFRAQPNPAFVPWHTMALFRYQRVKPNEAMAEFIFEMNDFLITLQNTPDAVKTPVPNTFGRFYDPKKKRYGPPHASSTAVYTEGLTDAFRLAVQRGDVQRRERYLQAVRWGLRSLFQLQYSPLMAPFSADPRAVVGGIRTSMNNGDIRVDNIQHSTMAFMAAQGLPLQPRE